MRYRMSKEVRDVLRGCRTDVSMLMTYYLQEYFNTGKNPNFKTEELRDFWFYLKVHELADQLQRYDNRFGDNYGTFEYLELQSILAKNSYKMLNKNFKIGGYHNGTRKE